MEKLRVFRLESLRESPEAFASTFENEQAFTKEAWEERLRNPRATTVIAVATPDLPSAAESAPTVTTILEGEWLASTTLIRFEGNEIAELSSSNISPWKRIPTDTESEPDGGGRGKNTVYALNGVYVIPKARGLGVASTLLNGALEVGHSMGRSEGAASVNFQARAISVNVGAVRLYEKAGFTVSLKETLVMKKHAAIGSSQQTVVYVMDR